MLLAEWRPTCTPAIPTVVLTVFLTVVLTVFLTVVLTVFLTVVLTVLLTAVPTVFLTVVLTVFLTVVLTVIPTVVSVTSKTSPPELPPPPVCGAAIPASGKKAAARLSPGGCPLGVRVLFHHSTTRPLDHSTTSAYSAITTFLENLCPSAANVQKYTPAGTLRPRASVRFQLM